MYQDETHPPMLNKLTEKLCSEGYTRENHPDNVFWSDWQNFGYKWEYALTLTWITPCGLFITGDSAIGRNVACGDMWFNGTWYCTENNNPDIQCPFNKKDCQHRISEMPLVRCACHMTGKPYDYNNSAERIIAEQNKLSQKQYIELSGGQCCACVVGNNGYRGGYWEVKYDVDRCIACGCKNEYCSITKQKRDLSPINILYNIRRTWITKKGFLEDTKTEIEKGVKVFSSPVYRSDAEIWLKTKQAEFIKSGSKKATEDRRQQYFTKHHRRYGDYEYFEFHYEVENIRIENVRAKRNLEQDLADIAEGIKVIHTSDKLKAAARVKKERRAKAKSKRISRLESLMRTVGYDNMEDIEKRRVDKAISKGDMEWIEKEVESVPKFEQIELGV